MNKYTKSENREDYTPVLLSNGTLSTMIDYLGVQMVQSPEKKEYLYPKPCIFWQDRRYNKPSPSLIPFGALSQSPGDALDWEQTLCCEDAATTCKTVFPEGLTIETTTFVCSVSDTLALRKVFSRPCNYTFSYTLSETPDGPSPRDMVFHTETSGDTVTISYTVTGLTEYKGTITIICRGLRPEVEGNCIRFKGKVEEKTDIIIHFRDNLLPPGETSDDFDTLYAMHKAGIDQYNSEGWVRVSDEQINDTYQTAAYDLRCVATPWGLPTGISNIHWNGYYFAFDEYFILLGLLTSGHLEAARRTVEFRYRGLKKAVLRAIWDYQGIMEARFPWVTTMDGNEYTSPGPHMEHIFHMANVALGAWDYCRISGDEAFLRDKAIEVMYACTGFFMYHMIYHDGDKTYIGKCTDLERLGPSRENAYMTTCGVIRTLRSFAKASELTGKYTDFAKKCATTAEELYKSLPNDGQKYLPYPGCREASIGVCAGTYPYRVHQSDNALEDAALKDYISRENEFGNMYKIGKGVSSWYSLWKGLTYIRHGKAEEGFDAVKQGIAETGVFHEMFEINEEACRYRPWFSTASGYFVQCVNEMLLQCRDGRIYIAPALPEEIKSASFKLPAEKGIFVEAEIDTVDGKHVVKSMKANQKCQVVMPDGNVRQLG